ncbi:hypothetical protein GCM10027586_21110 [Kineococcus gypseus]
MVAVAAIRPSSVQGKKVPSPTTGEKPQRHPANAAVLKAAAATARGHVRCFTGAVWRPESVLRVLTGGLLPARVQERTQGHSSSALRCAQRSRGWVQGLSTL